MSRTDLLSTRATAQQKARFGVLAQRHGVSESKLLSLLVDTVLEENKLGPSVKSVPKSRMAGRAGSRIGSEKLEATGPPMKFTIRLKGEDGEALTQRAAAREMAVATYLTQLVRAHLAASPPVPEQELAQLKRVISEVNAIAIGLHSMATAVARGIDLAPETRRMVDKLAPQKLIDQIEPKLKTCVEAVRAMLMANVRSWESADA